MHVQPAQMVKQLDDDENTAERSCCLPMLLMVMLHAAAAQICHRQLPKHSEGSGGELLRKQ